MINERLKIVVTGLAATYPFGGVFWDYLQYVLGFHRLGHDVLYLEDTGKWCYSPTQHTFVESGADNAAFLRQQIEVFEPELRDRWFYRDGAGKTFGRDEQQVRRFCGQCDLFLHVSASCWMRDEYWAAKRVAFLDSDPMYTQASIPDFVQGTADDSAADRVRMLQRHHVHFTFGENIGRKDCRIPTELIRWIPTRQPVVLDRLTPHRKPVSQRRRVLTTVASWEPHESGPVVGGVKYHGKSVEMEKLINLPKRLSVPVELAMSGRAPKQRLLDHGWTFEDPTVKSRDPWVYRDYLADSLGEWSVAKNAYVASRSGWFSCRSACYLALGVPVVVQDTGFASDIPKDRGVIAFHDEDSAAAAVQSLLNDPQGHAQAAVRIAQECFDSGKVLSRLIEAAIR